MNQTLAKPTAGASRPAPPKLPWRAMAVAMTLVALAAAGVAVALGRWMDGGSPAQALALAAGCAAAWLAALVGLVPVVWLARRGTQAVVAAYFAGLAARVLVCAAGGLAATVALELPWQPMLLAMGGAYTPLLLVEVIGISRYLVRLDETGPAAHDRPTQLGTEVTA